MVSSSVVVIHSVSPRSDYNLLVNMLPRRFRGEEDGSLFSFVSSSSSSCANNNNNNNNGINNNDSNSDLILVIPVKIASNVTEKPNHEFETISLDNPTNISPVPGPPSSTFVVTSFAALVLNENEFRSMEKNIFEKGEICKDAIEIREVSSSITSYDLIKIALPGGCLLTITTPNPYTNKGFRGKVVEFMTSPIEVQVTKSSESVLSPSHKSKLRHVSMRRSASMPDMIPPMGVVTTITNNNDNYYYYNTGNDDGDSISIKSIIRRNIAIIPTIEPMILSFRGNYRPVPLNSHIPFPIETELFTGRLLVIIRPSGDPATIDKFWNDRIFSKKKRRVIFQLQGKLKYKPTGKLFAGMEISNPMKLGLIANGLCNIILKLLKSCNPAIHYSFGTNDERAHICFPASTFFEKLIVTPPGDELPEMGKEFEEPPDEITARKANETKIDWNTEDTYSMSFFTQYIDFPTWSVVSLPIGKDISLQTFWGNSFASVVLYEVDSMLSEEKPHLAELNRYVLSLQLKRVEKDDNIANQLSNSGFLEDKQEEKSSQDGYESEFSDEQRHVCSEESISTADGGLALMPVFDEEDDHEDMMDGREEEDFTEFFDTIESLPIDFGSVPLDIISTNSHNTLLSIIDTFCPCWIDIFSKRGKYETYFAFYGGTKRPRPVFCTSEMTQEFFDDREITVIDNRFSHRVSSEERTRRILGLKYADAIINNNKKHPNLLESFYKSKSNCSANFLNRKETRKSVKAAGIIKTGFVARALSDRHWKEEGMILRDNVIIFHNVEGSKHQFRISLSSVIDVIVPEASIEPSPLPSYYFLQIETCVRVTYIMFRVEVERNSWASTLNGMLKSRDSIRSFSRELIESDDPVHEFLSKSTMWNCQKRKILNCRRYSFRSSHSKNAEDTLQLAELALEKVLLLRRNGEVVADDSNLRQFLDYAASLKDADARSLNEEEKLSFFLNLYHIMIMHSYIILGPPTGSEWISYFNTISYQCSDDILYVQCLRQTNLLISDKFILFFKLSFAHQPISQYLSIYFLYTFSVQLLNSSTTSFEPK